MGDDTSPRTRDQRLMAWDSLPRPVVTPSLLNCDFARISDELKALEQAGVGAVHLDVMDGHFVPNLSYGAPVIADWRPCTDFAFDTHLMISDPGRYLDDFVKAGCDTIIFHIEVAPDPTALIRRIRDAGCRASVAINPPTPFTAIEPYLADLDAILVMSVNPGFGGQKFEPSVLEKVRAARRARPDLWISIDGGINPTTAQLAVSAGATQLVAGSAIFKTRDGHYAAAFGELTESARRDTERGEATARPADAASQ